jgi:ankyrin repeat protein
MEATRLGRTRLVQWLVEQGAAPAFLCGLPMRTALHCAIRRHHWGIAKLLASAMPSCAVMDVYGATPLHALSSESASCDSENIMLSLARLFIEKSCPLDALDHEGTTALHHAVLNDALPLATCVLQSGANPNALIPDSKVSPLTIAALEKNAAMAKLLLQYGANPHVRTREGTSPLSLFPSMGRYIDAASATRSAAPIRNAVMH